MSRSGDKDTGEDDSRTDHSANDVRRGRPGTF